MWSALMTGAVAAAFLHAFYRAVRVKWPTNYFSQTRELDFQTSRGRARYFAFRFAPVFVAAEFVAVTADRTEDYSLVAVLFMWLLHAGDTAGRTLTIFARQRLSGRGASVSQAALAGGTFVGTLLVCMAAWILRGQLTPLIPKPSALIESVWTATFAAIIAAYVMNATKKSVELSDVVESERQSLSNRGLISALDAAATNNHVSREFLLALMIGESLERPRWFRQLERSLSFTRRWATYGIMQVGSSRPLSDVESIDQTAAAYAGYFPKHTGTGPIDPPLRAAISRHNPDDGFVDLVTDIYRLVAPAGTYHTAAATPDGRPLLEVVDTKQRGEQWVITGSANASAGLPTATYLENGVASAVSVQAVSVAATRIEWRAILPITVENVTFRVPAEVDDEAHRVVVTTHYVY